jgi:hypothetical protein
VSQQQRIAAESRGSEAGLGTGMAAADYDDVKTLRIVHASTYGVGKAADYTAANHPRKNLLKFSPVGKKGFY